MKLLWSSLIAFLILEYFDLLFQILCNPAVSIYGISLAVIVSKDFFSFLFIANKLQ